MKFDPEIENLELSWDKYMQYVEPSKDPAIREIQWADVRELAEQDVWHDRLNKLSRLESANNAIDRLAELGLDELNSRMDAAGAVYPPTSEDRKRWADNNGVKYESEWESSCKKLGHIKDRLMVGRIAHHLSIKIQKERIKSAVMLPTILKVNPTSLESAIAFSLWKTYYVSNFLDDEMDTISTDSCS